jgi:hypothetical protein
MGYVAQRDGTAVRQAEAGGALSRAPKADVTSRSAQLEEEPPHDGVAVTSRPSSLSRVKIVTSSWLYSISPLHCKGPAASATVVRRVPSMCDRNCCVRRHSFPPKRSCTMSSQRANRDAASWSLLHAANCWFVNDRFWSKASTRVRTSSNSRKLFAYPRTAIGSQRLQPA